MKGSLEEKHLAKEKGFKSYHEYLGHLAKEKIFKIGVIIGVCSSYFQQDIGIESIVLWGELYMSEYKTICSTRIESCVDEKEFNDKIIITDKYVYK